MQMQTLSLTRHLRTPETPKTPVDTETSVTLVPVHSATPVDSNSPVTLTPVHTATQGAIDIPVHSVASPHYCGIR